MQQHLDRRHSEEIESTNFLNLLSQRYTLSYLHGKNSTYVHDDLFRSLCSELRTALSFGGLVEEEVDVWDSLCNNSLAFLLKTAQTSNTQNITKRKANRVSLVPHFQKCCYDETLWEQATPAAFWDSKSLPNKHHNIKVVPFVPCCPFAQGIH